MKKILSILVLFLVFVNVAEAVTARTRYVNTASSAGGDCSTNATSGSARACATLSDAIVNNAADLVAADVYLDVICEGSSPDTSAVNITGYTTDATHYIGIRTTQANRHDGKWNTSKYRIENSDYFKVINIDESFVRIDGLQIKTTGNDDAGARAILLASGAANGDIRITNTIMRYAPTGTTTTSNTNQAIRVPSGTANGIKLTLVNNIAYDFHRGSLSFTTDGTDGDQLYAYNNTFYNSDSGAGNSLEMSLYGTNDTVKLRNNVIQACGGGCYFRDGTASTFTTQDNVTQDASSPDGASYQSKTVSFVDTSGRDLHLQAGDTAAKGQAADLSADGDYAFSTDIDGTARVAPWDCGADQQGSGGGGGGGTLGRGFNTGFN